MIGALRRRIRAVTAALFTVGAVLSIGAGVCGAATRQASAHIAGVLGGKATARLHLVQVEGSELNEEGPVAGVLTGTARGTLHLGAVFIASFTIHTRNGSISGRGTAIPHGTGRYQSFAGSFSATDGSGRYAHISGRAGLYGVLDRRTDSVVIQTTGRLTF
jgi:hypothetical protein